MAAHPSSGLNSPATSLNSKHSYIRTGELPIELINSILSHHNNTLKTIMKSKHCPVFERSKLERFSTFATNFIQYLTMLKYTGGGIYKIEDILKSLKRSSLILKELINDDYIIANQKTGEDETYSSIEVCEDIIRFSLAWIFQELNRPKGFDHWIWDWRWVIAILAANNKNFASWQVVRSNVNIHLTEIVDVCIRSASRSITNEDACKLCMEALHASKLVMYIDRFLMNLNTVESTRLELIDRFLCLGECCFQTKSETSIFKQILGDVLYDDIMLIRNSVISILQNKTKLSRALKVSNDDLIERLGKYRIRVRNSGLVTFRDSLLKMSDHERENALKAPRFRDVEFLDSKLVDKDKNYSCNGTPVDLWNLFQPLSEECKRSDINDESKLRFIYCMIEMVSECKRKLSDSANLTVDREVLETLRHGNPLFSRGVFPFEKSAVEVFRVRRKRAYYEMIHVIYEYGDRKLF